MGVTGTVFVAVGRVGRAWVGVGEAGSRVWVMVAVAVEVWVGARVAGGWGVVVGSGAGAPDWQAESSEMRRRRVIAKRR